MPETPTQGRDDGETPDERRFRELVTGDIDIRIARDGTWYHEGGAIRRPALVRLFAGILHRDETGDFYLETPVERRRIVVEDAPFVAVAVDAGTEAGEPVLTFRTNVDDSVRAGPGHPIRVRFDPRTGEPSPYVLVRDGLEALIARPVYYELVAMGEPATVDGREALVVRSRGESYVLGFPE